MKSKSIAYLTIALLLFSPFVLAANETFTYKNARGSELNLIFADDDSLTGTFTTAVAAKECQQAIGMKRPVIGYTAQDSITFSVNYPECGSVVTFIGNIKKNKTVIDTMAIVTYPLSQSKKKKSKAKTISRDVFTKI